MQTSRGKVIARKTMGELSKETGYKFEGVNPRMAVSTWAKKIGVPSLGKFYDRVTNKLPKQEVDKEGASDDQ